MGTHSSSLAWKIPCQRSLVGYSPWGRKESDTAEQLSMHARVLKYTFQYKYYILYTSNNACVTL